MHRGTLRVPFVAETLRQGLVSPWRHLELVEETGYAAASIEPLMTGAASSGLSSEIVTLFRASGLSRVGSGGGHAGEGITVHEVHVAELDEWLESKARSGLLIDPKIYAGLYFISRQT